MKLSFAPVRLLKYEEKFNVETYKATAAKHAMVILKCFGTFQIYTIICNSKQQEVQRLK